MDEETNVNDNYYEDDTTNTASSTNPDPDANINLSYGKFNLNGSVNLVPHHPVLIDLLVEMLISLLLDIKTE